MLYDVFFHNKYLNMFKNPKKDNELLRYVIKNGNIINKNLWLVSGSNIDTVVDIRSIKKMSRISNDDDFIELMNEIYEEYYKNAYRKKDYVLRSNQLKVDNKLDINALSDVLYQISDIEIKSLQIYPIISFRSSGLITKKENILYGNENYNSTIQTLFHEIGHLIMMRAKTDNEISCSGERTAELSAFLIQFKISREMGIKLNERAILRSNFLKWHRKYENMINKNTIIYEMQNILKK